MTTYYNLSPDVYDDCAKVFYFSLVKQEINNTDGKNNFDYKYDVSSIIKTAKSGCSYDNERFFFLSQDKRDNNMGYQVCFCLNCGNYQKDYTHSDVSKNAICYCE